MVFTHRLSQIEMDSILEVVKTSNQITGNLVDTIKTCKDMLGTVDISALKQSYETAVSFLQQQEAERKLDERFAAILCKANWPPCLDLTNDGILSIIKAYDKTSDFLQFKSELDKALIDYYDNDVLAEKLASWNSKSFIAHRMPILTKVMDAHRRKDYLLSVPVILAQTEGIIAEGKGHIGQLKQKEIKDYLEILYKDHILKVLSSSMKQFVSSSVFTGFEWGSPLTAALSRNAILHGADTNYGTEINSLVEVQRNSPPGSKRIPQLGPN